jgi:TolA-binding protein
MPFLSHRSISLLVILIMFPVVLHTQGLSDEKENFDLAQRLFEDGDYANAAQEFSRFFENYPTSDRLPTALLRLSLTYYNSANYKKAIEACQKFIDQYPKRLEVATTMRRKAEAHQMLGEFTRAGQAYQEVHNAYPGGEYAPQDLLSAGYNHHKGGDLETAERVFRDLISQHSGSPLYYEATYNLGLVLLEADQLEEALAQFHAIVNYPEPTERKPDALLEIGKVALFTDDLKAAEKTFAKLRKQYPVSGSAQTSYLVLASWFAAAEKWESAEQIYRQARSDLPRNENRQLAVLGLAHVTRKLGQKEEALSLYTQFLNVYQDSPHLASCWLGLGRASVDLGDFRKAMAAFDRLQDEFPDSESSIEAYSDIGDVWRKLGTPGKALKAYETYRDRASGSEARASAQLRIGLTYEKDLDWFDMAVETYRRVIDTTLPRYASEGQFGIARTFEKTGQFALATREYSRYIKNYPDGRRARESENRIKLLSEFEPNIHGALADSLVALLSRLPEVSSSPDSRFQLGKFLAASSRHTPAAEQLISFLATDSSSGHAPEAAYLLGESLLALSRKSQLESKDTEAGEYRATGLDAHRKVLGNYAKSEWSDDSAISVAEAEAQHLFPDTTRARYLLDAYRKFQRKNPRSSRLSFARLRIADAHRFLGEFEITHLDTAQEIYAEIASSDTGANLQEHAVFGMGLCQAFAENHIAAEETLRSFLFDYPRSPLADEAQYHLGRTFLERGLYRSAADELSELLVSPSSLDLEGACRSLLAECYFRLGDFKKAIKIDEGLLLRRLDGRLLKRLATAYQEDQQPDKAVRTYANFLRNFPNATDADSIAFHRAELMSFMDRKPEAIAAFREFGGKFPESPLQNKANRSLADLLFAANDYESALSIYRSIPEQYQTESAAGHAVLCLYRLKRLKEAKKATNQYKKSFHNVTDWLARFKIEEGKYELEAGRNKKARSIFGEVLKKSAAQAIRSEASYYHAQALKKEGKHEEFLGALSAYVKAYRDSQDWARATLELADLYYEGEDFARASRAYQQVLDVGVAQEERPEILLKLMKVHKNQKFFDTAIAYARRFVTDYPRSEQATDTRMDIGNMLQAKGNHRQAIQELKPLQKVVKGDDWSSVQHTIALSYLALKDIESATREFLKLQYQFQGSALWLASAHYGLADCYEARGAYKEAIQELEEIQRRFGPTSNFGITAGDRIGKLQSLIVNAPRYSTPDKQE